MNNHISRINQIDALIKSIDKLVANGEYKAAGITIGLHVGPLSQDNDLDIRIDLCDNLDSVLSEIRAGLIAARAARLSYAKSDLAELESFFSSTQAQ